jgi:methylamine--corrinoid protein Co-methyltransferase
MVSFWEVLDRAINTGPRMEPKEFDMLIFKKADELVKEYGFEYDPNNPVPSDDGLADDLFEAGKRLYLETGTYCISSQRVIKFSEEEVRQALRSVPTSVLIGEGAETRLLERRGIEDRKEPLNIGGVIESNPQEGEIFVKLYQSIAQEKEIDGLYYGPSPTIEGKLWRPNTSLEVHAGICATSWVREALRRVGRPGLHLTSACPSAIGDIASCDPERGVKPTDALALPVTTELKTEYDTLSKITYSINYGCLRNPYWLPMVGGYSGGPEGAAVVGVAGGFHAILVYQMGPGYSSCASTTIERPGQSSRNTIWVTNVVWNALTRNTNLIGGIGCTTRAGPGTEMMFQETAATAIGAVPYGVHLQHGIRKAVLVKPTQGSGLEPKFQGEVAKAAARLKREDANEIVKALLSRYEHKIHSAPQGNGFEELYDLKTITPRKEYLEIYLRVKRELQDLGLPLS